MEEPHACVALVRGDSRYGSVSAALRAVEDRIDLGDVQRLLIKPNFVSVERQLASTHVDAVRAVLDFVRARYDGSIVVAEGAAVAPTSEGFRRFGYDSLVDMYGVELLDLNADESVPVQVYDRRLRPITVYLARTAVEADYRITVGPPKTHDVVIVTLSIKNMVMGALVNPRVTSDGGALFAVAQWLARLIPHPWRHSASVERLKAAILGSRFGSSKMAMHQGVRVINLNLAMVAPHVWPDLAVIDGWSGMEGEGPSAGDEVEWRVALAGPDPLAVDTLTTELMGFDPENVGYLQYCRDLDLGVGEVSRINVVGDISSGNVEGAFEPHPTYEDQLDWPVKDARRYLQSAPEARTDIVGVSEEW